MEKISVILPIYNVENYLEKSLNSVINQTYENLEIILVNDGSTDSSEVICKKYIEIDNRIKLINKTNGGLSSARNVGFENSTGNFVIFIDSDDYIENNMIEILYNNIKKEKADVSVCGIYNVYTNSKTSQCADTNIYMNLNSDEFLKEYLIGEKVPGSICNKLLKREIAEKLNFPIGKIYEDAFYHFDLIKIAKKFIVTTKPMYYYFHRENSITTKNYSKKNMDCIEIYTKFYDYVSKEKPSLEKEAFFRLSYSYFTVMDKMLLNNNFKKIEDYKKVLKFLKNNFFKIYKNDIFRKNRRISVILLKINIMLYRFVLMLDLKRKKIN